jgi:HK97 family phage prohead protease
MEQLIIKQSQVNLTDLSEGYLVGIANQYNIKDLQGDISNPASFIKTVSEQKTKLKIYKNHDDNLLIGVPTELDAHDSRGLKLTAKMLMDTQLGRDAYIESKFLVENGFESGFSIGGWVIKRNPKNKSEVLEYKLKEISLLTKEQANQGSMVELVKSIQQEGELTQQKFWETITKAYDNTKFSDTILKSLELFLSLEAKPTDDVTLKEEPMPKIITSIYDLFI